MGKYLVSYMIGRQCWGDLVVTANFPISSQDLIAIRKGILANEPFKDGLTTRDVVIINIFELAEDRESAESEENVQSG